MFVAPNRDETGDVGIGIPGSLGSIGENEIVDAASVRADYLQALAELRERYRTTCLSMGADYVPLDTSMPFDKALVEYLSQRQARF